MSDKKDPFEHLTDKQRQRLANLTAEILFDKITVSFSLETREGSKKSSFYSATVSRGVDPLTQSEPHPEGSWRPDEVKVVRSILSKHVVAACYDDAVRRRQMTPNQAREEVHPILAAYDNNIAKNLANGSE